MYVTNSNGALTDPRLGSFTYITRPNTPEIQVSNQMQKNSDVSEI